ncbi:MAG: hypothetical protein QXY18_01465 [Nitrososphaerota archaeon]
MEKCHNHPYISSIGKCIICDKNLCELCAYIIDGKIYCEIHADEILSKKAPPIKRITIPKLTSNLLFLIGIMGIITIFLLPLGIISATTLFCYANFSCWYPILLSCNR